MPKALTPQLRKILAHVERVGYITARAALIDHGIVSLSRRIVDLKELGFRVTKERTKNEATGQQYVRYYVRRGMTPGARVRVKTMRWGAEQHGKTGVITEVNRPGYLLQCSVKYDTPLVLGSGRSAYQHADNGYDFSDLELID